MLREKSSDELGHFVALSLDFQKVIEALFLESGKFQRLQKVEGVDCHQVDHHREHEFEVPGEQQGDPSCREDHGIGDDHLSEAEQDTATHDRAVKDSTEYDFKRDFLSTKKNLKRMKKIHFEEN